MKRKQYSDKGKPWDGDLSRIPPQGTLVAIPTASNGLVNAIVSGYEITWHKNNPQIRIDVTECQGKCKNQRMLSDLHFPLTAREQESD